VERVTLLRGELALGKANLGLLTSILEREGNHRLSIVRMGWIPTKRVGQTSGRFNFPELARQVEEVAIGRLHRDPIATADPQVEVDVRGGEASRTPPLAELFGVGQRSVHGRARSSESSLEPEHEMLACHVVHLQSVFALLSSRSGRTGSRVCAASSVVDQWRLGSRPAASCPRKG
jgi:hypothetical protein